MLEIIANKNIERDSFNFDGLDEEFDKVISICSKCKYLIIESYSGKILFSYLSYRWACKKYNKLAFGIDM